MPANLQSTMLDALELFHYSYRFRDALFIIALENSSRIHEIITDLRVLQSSHIRAMILCEAESNLPQTLGAWEKRGARFHYLAREAGELDQLDTEIQKTLDNDMIPVVGVTTSSRDGLWIEQTAMNLASRYGAEKVFLLADRGGLVVDGALLPQPTGEELAALLRKKVKLNMKPEVLAYLAEQSESHGIDIVLLPPAAGALFQEIFTHRGAGTLISQSYPNEIRPAVIEDVTTISLLLKPYIQIGMIRAVTEDEVAASISAYFVYTVNKEPVAVAMLKDFGDSAELARIGTLPRYQRRGRARELSQHLISLARTQGKKDVFALSVEPQMWEFFGSLGMSEVPRDSLPADWQSGYDSSRPSKAFRIDFV